MLIEVNEASKEGLSKISIRHGDQCSEWNASIYDRTSFNDVEGIFRDINAYWSRLPVTRQAAIWKIYSDIKEVIYNIQDPTRLHSKLVHLVKDLYDQHPMDEISHYRKFYADIRYPTNLKDDYAPGDSPERTYLRSDYMGLVDLAIALRPMVPLWGEYIKRIRTEAGSNFKEQVGMGLLARASIMQSEPMIRMQNYVESNIAYETATPSAVLNGLGTTQLGDWLLALTVVRRLSIGDISAVDNNSSLISNAYGFITSTLNSMDRKFGNKITEKHRTNDPIEEDNASLIETYKVKQEVSDGDLAVLSIHTENVVTMALRIEPELDPALIEACHQAALPLGEMEICPHHLTLCQWVMAPVVPARGVPNLNKPALLRVMAATQAILWHWGFPDLAALATAQPAERVGDIMVGGQEGNTRGRIPREMVDQLAELYPHYQQQGGKSRRDSIDEKRSRDRQVNVACRAIEALAREMTKQDWVINGIDRLVAQTTSINGTRRLAAPGDLRAQLAKLLINHIAIR